MTSPLIFDRRHVRHNRARAAGRMAEHAFLFDWAIDNLRDRLDIVKRRFPVALQIGGRGTAARRDSLIAAAGINSLTVLDNAPGALTTLIADEEYLPFAPQSFDLIFSPLSLHTVNDLPGALIQIRRALKADGLFIAALPGGETLYELRACLMEAELSLKGGTAPRVAPFADKQQAGAVMQRAGFALPVVDSEIVTVTYRTLTALLHDLRGMGETNAVLSRHRGFTGKALWRETERIYRARFGEPDGRLPATFEIIFLIGWAPHASQQKPLRPGSAAQRLADALETVEVGTGETARP